VFHFREYGSNVIGSMTSGGQATSEPKMGGDDIEPPPNERGTRDFNKPSGNNGAPNLCTLGNIFKMFTAMNK
jgi:hypothetical protein